MVKINANALRNMMPTGKDITLEYMPKDNYDAEPLKMTFTIFPMKVEEKGKLQQILDANKESSDDGPEAKQKKAEAIANAILQMLHSVLSKSVDELTLEDVKNLPEMWKKEIIRQVFLFEGIDIDKAPKND